jgi:TonB-linked SusC/RagA family outer membrane protein
LNEYLLSFLALANSNKLKMRTKFRVILTLLLAFVVQISFAQQKTVSGNVVDGDGLPVPGVDVQIKGTQTGTQTDFDGNYSVSVSSGQTLVFSYVGLKTQEILVGNQTVINVTMQTNLEELDAVVVTSYQGILKESEVVSSSSTVKSEAIEQVPIASIDQVLQGNVAGANIRTASGQPGQSATILIRGRTSLRGDSEPLFIVDGMPVNQDNFRNINSNDIETMRVLKDAAATAIYGNRGAAGVILITTKRAKKNENLKVQYRGLYGVATLPEQNFSVMNTRQLLNYRREVVPGNQFGDNLTPAEVEALANSVSTNWADIIQQQGETESHELIVTSGGQNLSSFTSMQYFQQEGTTLRSRLERFSVRNNLSGSFEKFNYSSNVSISYSKNDFVVDAARGNNTGGQLDNPFIVPFLALPYLNPYNPDGSLNTFGTVASGALNENGTINVDGANGFLNTPFIALNTARNNTDRENELRIVGSLQADYNVIKNVTVGASVGTDYIHSQDLFREDPLSIRGLFTRDALADDSFFGGTQAEFSTRDFSFNTNAFVRYTNTFDEKHTVNAAAFTEYFYRNFQFMGFTQNGLNPKFPGSEAGFTSGETLVDGAPVFAPTVRSVESELALFSYFGNVTYDYDGRFGLDVTVRRDGTSRFQEENRWGTFYSVGARWNVDQESFMEDVDWVSSLKVRASHGQTGNQGIGDFYQAFQRVAGGAGYQNANQLAPDGFVDENIIWETTTQTNIGFDYGFWNNRLTGALDFYYKRTDDLFFGRNIAPSGTGFSNVDTNVAVMDNTGVELQVAYDILRKSPTNDWNVSVFFNGAYNENEVVDIANETGFVEFGGFGQRIQEGERANVFFLQRWAGIDPSNGQPLYYDAEGNITNILNRAEEGVYLDKQFDPVFTGGFGTNISWKGFTVSALFSFAAETYRMNSSLALLEDFDLAAITNYSTTMFDVWQQPGDVATIPAPAQAAGLRITSSNQTDRYLEDASFLRLRNANIAYNLSKETLDKIGLFTAVRVYAQGTNLVTWSKWRGYDPESNDVAEFFSFPSPTTVSFGLDLTF